MENLEKQIENKADVMVRKQSNVDLNEIQKQYLGKQVSEGKSLTDITNDFAKAQTTSEIMRNEDGKYDDLHKELAKEQQQTIKESFKKDKVKAQEQTITEKQKKAEAFYVSFRPILEFDFSPLIHKENKNSGENEEKPQKTYKDRSYGISLMCLMLFLFVVPYCIFSIFLALFNGVNAIFEAISTFGKIARVIATSVFILVIGCLIIYCALLGIDALFGTEIVSSIGL